MSDWSFPPVPSHGHYEHVPYGPYICVVVNGMGEFCVSLWRKTANENHVCHVLHNGKVVDRPAREPSWEDYEADKYDPHMELIPIPVEEFHRIKLVARHLLTTEAWVERACRVAERNRQVT